MTIVARNRNELLMHQAQLQQVANQLDERAAQIQFEHDRLIEQQNQMRAMIEANQKIVRDNELFLFAIKQNTINVIKDYKRVSKILDDVVRQNHNPEKVFMELVGVRAKISEMEQYFHNTFHMTPSQFKEIEKNKSKLN